VSGGCGGDGIGAVGLRLSLDGDSGQACGNCGARGRSGRCCATGSWSSSSCCHSCTTEANGVQAGLSGSGSGIDGTLGSFGSPASGAGSSYRLTGSDEIHDGLGSGTARSDAAG
jgi:hypothetical protein